MEPQYVPEINVLMAVMKWLHSEGWAIEGLSIAHGAGIDSVTGKDRVRAELRELGIQGDGTRFVPTGEDIRATKDGIVWRIECKGLAESMKPSTMRNQFDRALASVVSHYDQTQGLRLGLALPEEYSGHIKTRLPQPLRTALNLWVLLYVSADEEVYVFGPPEDLPF